MRLPFSTRINNGRRHKDNGLGRGILDAIRSTKRGGNGIKLAGCAGQAGRIGCLGIACQTCQNNHVTWCQPEFGRDGVGCFVRFIGDPTKCRGKPCVFKFDSSRYVKAEDYWTLILFCI